MSYYDGRVPSRAAFHFDETVKLEEPPFVMPALRRPPFGPADIRDALLLFKSPAGQPGRRLRLEPGHAGRPAARRRRARSGAAARCPRRLPYLVDDPDPVHRRHAAGHVRRAGRPWGRPAQPGGAGLPVHHRRAGLPAKADRARRCAGPRPRRTRGLVTFSHRPLPARRGPGPSAAARASLRALGHGHRRRPGPHASSAPARPRWRRSSGPCVATTSSRCRSPPGMRSSMATTRPHAPASRS